MRSLVSGRPRGSSAVTVMSDRLSRVRLRARQHQQRHVWACRSCVRRTVRPVDVQHTLQVWTHTACWACIIRRVIQTQADSCHLSGLFNTFSIWVSGSDVSLRWSHSERRLHADVECFSRLINIVRPPAREKSPAAVTEVELLHRSLFGRFPSHAESMRDVVLVCGTFWCVWDCRSDDEWSICVLETVLTVHRLLWSGYLCFHQLKRVKGTRQHTCHSSDAMTVTMYKLLQNQFLYTSL